MNKHLFYSIYKTLVINRLFCSVTSFTSTNMRAVQLKAPGAPDNMYVDANVSLPEISSPKHMLVKVVATAINRADTLQRKGSYNAPKGESTILGLEASGVIESVGENIEKFKVGDHVMVLLGGGGYAEYVAVHENMVMKLPSNFDLVTAAAIPEAWLTAYQLLYFNAKIKPGDTVLIHAAGSGVGTAAIQLVKAVANTKVVATAGTAEKLELAKSLGADVLINYKEQDIAAEVKEATEGKGVDIILDPVGASYWNLNIQSLAIDGQWVLYGLLGGAKIDGNLFGQLLGKRGKLMASTLRTRSLEYKGELVSAFAAACIEKFESKQLHPIIDSIMTLDDVVAAHTRMESNLNKGKIIMKVQEADAKKQEL